MPLRTNAQGGSFRPNTIKKTYPIADGITIKRGDLLHIINVNGLEYVTNVISGDDTVDAIAIFSGESGASISCYVMNNINTYEDLEKFTYEFLSQFTYGELLRSIKIKQTN